MSKGSGGGGAGGMTRGSRSNSGVLGNESPIEITNEKSRSGGNNWKKRVFEASAAEGTDGVLNLDYANPKSYKQINNNTTQGQFSINAGIYDVSNSGRLVSHNIDWSKVKEVTGRTYEIKDFLKSSGFSFNPSSKTWVKK
jgi:hypothetical protein